MIQPDYTFYLKTADGHRGAMLPDVMSLDVTFRWNEVTKWSMTGAGLTPCPFGKGSGLIVYRGEDAFLSGFVTAITDSYDTASGIYDWAAEGEDDLGKLARRVIYPDPTAAGVQPNAEYSAEGHQADLLLALVKASISAAADLAERRDQTLGTQAPEGVGDEVTITACYDELLKFVLDQLKDGSLGISTVWDGASGVSEVRFSVPNDVSDTVVFSVETGSLAGWQRKREAPKANVILAKGCEITSDGTPTGTWQTVTVSDAASVAAWGRHELFVDHGDIQPVVEKDSGGNIISQESWSSVAERLRQAALTDLENNSAQDGYELVIVELDRMAYKVHWDIGDTVSIRIAETEIKAPIREIKVSYTGGVETVTPSVGELQKGELQSVFDELGRLKEQVSVLYKKEK